MSCYVGEPCVGFGCRVELLPFWQVVSSGDALKLKPSSTSESPAVLTWICCADMTSGSALRRPVLPALTKSCIAMLHSAIIIITLSDATLRNKIFQIKNWISSIINNSILHIVFKIKKNIWVTKVAPCKSILTELHAMIFWCQNPTKGDIRIPQETTNITFDFSSFWMMLLSESYYIFFGGGRGHWFQIPKFVCKQKEKTEHYSPKCLKKTYLWCIHSLNLAKFFCLSLLHTGIQSH